MNQTAWHQIAIVSLVLLATSSTIQSQNISSCLLNKEILAQRHIKYTINEESHQLKNNQTFNTTCEDGYTLFLPTKDNIEHQKPSNFSQIQKSLEIICDENGILEYKYADEECNDVICDEYCKKFYTKKEIESHTDMNLDYNLQDEFFFPGETLDADCKEDFYITLTNNKGKITFEDLDLPIKLKNCGTESDCKPAFDDPIWIDKYTCRKPMCDKTYVEKFLHIKAETNTPGENTTIVCIGNSKELGELSCVFDNENLTSYWLDMDGNELKADTYQCPKVCQIQKEILANYNIQIKLRGRPRPPQPIDPTMYAFDGENLLFECMPGFIRDTSYNETTINTPFNSTCEEGVLKNIESKCLNDTCVDPPDEDQFHVKPIFYTGSAECSDGYESENSDIGTHIFLICKSNIWMPAKENGQEMKCTKKALKQCVEFNAYPTMLNKEEDNNSTQLVDHGTKVDVRCMRGFSVANNIGGALVCNDSVWYLDDVPIPDNSCQPSVCDINPDNFNVIADSKTTGNFKCLPGYSVVYIKQSKDVVLLCNIGIWESASDEDICYKKCSTTSDIQVLDGTKELVHGELVNVYCLNKAVPVGGPLARCHDGQFMHVDNEEQNMADDTKVKTCAQKMTTAPPSDGNGDGDDDGSSDGDENGEDSIEESSDGASSKEFFAWLIIPIFISCN